ncbi:hypothetical protein Plec18170_009102 [Paecilomyces lecythidis]
MEDDTRLRVAMPGRLLNAILHNIDEDQRLVAMNFAATTIIKYPIINLRRYTHLGALFSLVAGQHWRAAIIKINCLSKINCVGIFTTELKAIKMYKMEFLHTSQMVRNKIDINHPASGGDMFCRFHQAWSGLTPEQRREVMIQSIILIPNRSCEVWPLLPISHNFLVSYLISESYSNWKRVLEDALAYVQYYIPDLVVI